MLEVIQSHPGNASYDEIMRELAYQQMVESGLDDSQQSKVIDNEEMQCRIQAWQN